MLRVQCPHTYNLLTSDITTTYLRDIELAISKTLLLDMFNMFLNCEHLPSTPPGEFPVPSIASTAVSYRAKPDLLIRIFVRKLNILTLKLFNIR